MSLRVFYTDENSPKFHFDSPSNSSRSCTLAYLNEGGANFVFRILPGKAEEDFPCHLRGKLLRLRKDLPHVQSAREQLAAFEEHFKPLLPVENLIQHELVELERGFASHLNTVLARMQRPPKRRNDFLPTDEAFGILVTDMVPREGQVLIQLKPKWLAQSFTAPEEAKRCRTCALRAQRASQGRSTATDAQESCPLSLVSENAEERRLAVGKVTTDRELQDYLVNKAPILLHALRAAQTNLDSTGVFNLNSKDSVLAYCKAMTLRDCTLFVKRSEHDVEARIADLDLKLPEKLATWKTVEQELILGGWYTNTEDETFRREEAICLLARHSFPD